MPLFDTSKELKATNSAFSISFELENIQSFLDDAERKYLVPYIGEETVSSVLAAKKNGLSPKSLEAQLLVLFQKAVLGFAFGDYATFGALQIQDAGISVLSRENFRPASERKIAELRKQSIRTGFEFLEASIDFLEQHLQNFPSYRQSKARAENRCSFICSSKVFSKVCVPIHASVFFQLRAELVQQELEAIAPILGKTVLEKLKKSFLDSTQEQEPVDEQIILRIQRAIAPLALAETIPYNGLVIDANGSFETNSGTALSASEEARLQAALFQLVAQGRAGLERLKKYLNNHGSKNSQEENRSATSKNSVQQSNLYFF